MRAPVWVVKVRGQGSVSADLYYSLALYDGWFSTSQRAAYRYRLRADAERRAAAFPGARVVRLVPRKRGGR